ncbi:Na(+)/H(+) antiporter NhaH [Chryseobacterium aquaeductus]|uniref:Na(+)/H(+) antiporter NhaH n=1 Tax=Chryseobacterium aquaeductus TaxID=2675056 RepID=A0A9N8MGL8_9FLAO|nr:cation:proton antiporter [Chryseobacterium aquaeductus]CAA7331414.1 Na(+)/H(+) antiporter NhaH [Chryseobacterium potabilaquae]CAD7810061.1 Na(+)/H(+) antiporter NhaH [Chryseobacterium aquaeductus]
MDQYILILTVIGIAIFSMVWMPKISQFTGVSYSVFFVFFGFLLYLLFPQHLPNPLPQKNESITLHLTELIVIISIMGTGIKIDRPFSLKSWASPLKLITITMILCIIVATFLGYYYLGLGLASATLLGAVLAPTDPVLASDVQVGPPNEDGKSETKFALTSEAGLNDGVAFPFTWLAICVGFSLAGQDVSFFKWFTYDLLYRICVGLLVGYIIGKAIGYLIFKVAAKYKILKTRDGLLAIAATLVVYGITEIIHGYGFIAVFVCAITLRHYEKGSHYHDELHSFTDQVERSLLCILLILFGGALAMGILEKLTWKMVMFSLSFLLIVRPLFGWLAVSKSKIDLREKLAIGFFGIRGMGSVFYLAFAFSKFDFEHQDELWALVIFTILLSIIMHGFTANPIMKRIADLEFKIDKKLS